MPRSGAYNGGHQRAQNASENVISMPIYSTKISVITLLNRVDVLQAKT